MSEPNVVESQALDAFKPLREGPEAVRRIIEHVLKLEQEHLFQRAPRLIDDVVKVIREEVK